MLPLVGDWGYNDSTLHHLAQGWPCGAVGVGSPHQGTKTTKRKDLENLFCWAGTSVLLMYIISEEQKGILDAWLFG